MNVWWQLLAAGLGGGGLAGVIGSLVAGLWQRPKVRADAVASLTDSAIKQVNELQERTTEAERRAGDAERAADDARRKVRLLSDELDSLLATVRSWRTAILTSTTTDDLARLHQMVTAAPPTNGRAL